MQTKYVIATVILLFFILLGLGSVLSERCINVGACNSCWKTTVAVVESDLCGGNQTCLAQPEDQQNNAIVDAVLCGCSKAKSSNYADVNLNREIEDVISQFTRFNITVNEICEQPGLFLVKRSYV